MLPKKEFFIGTRPIISFAKKKGKQQKMTKDFKALFLSKADILSNFK